ncbi:MAG: hypothetical protein ACYDBH_10360 [Acidobacteriaceae bacterium]
MVGFDASIALAVWYPDVPCSVERAKERVEYLIEFLETKHERIMIPTPALSELLVRAGGAGPALVNQLSKSSRFEIAPFDDLAAIEVAIAIAAAKRIGNKRGKNLTENWAKVKFDHQIVAICKVRGVSTLYSDDPALCNFASSCGIHTIRLGELPLRPQEQTLFDLIDEEVEPSGDNESTEPPRQLPTPIPEKTD